MNKIIIVVSSLLLSVGLISGCQQDAENAPAAAAQGAETAPAQGAAQQAKVVDLMATPAAAPSVANGMVTGQVAETIAAGGYTYARVDVDGQALWAAGPPTPMAVGDTITFSTMIPMKNFHSKAMNRDFPVLYFVDSFSVQGSPSAASAASSEQVSAAPVAEVAMENIEKVAGGYTIAEILAQRNDLTEKPIKVRGKVTKVVNGIMGKNWVHISDSSGDADFIVTTSGTASTSQVVVAEGKLSLNRDFGYGYKYDILMEDATVMAE